MKGFVPTPKETVDLMVDRLFVNRRPTADSLVLDPGCGEGEFIAGILRWCAKNQASIPRMVGIESNPRHVAVARRRFSAFSSVEIREADFLRDPRVGCYDFIVGNPPYVPITGLSEREKERYREQFKTAIGRFDLYLLFFEQALKLLKLDGRLVFITPEKFLYVETAQSLRRMLVEKNVEEIHLINEETFEDLVTYPTITTISNQISRGFASVILRSGEHVRIFPPSDGSSWLPAIMGHRADSSAQKLVEICVRISCGVATGADEVFVRATEEIGPGLTKFAYPTIAGRELGEANGNLRFKKMMLIPYDHDSELLPEGKLGEFRSDLSRAANRSRLERRTCVRQKPWYAFHETPPLKDILRPKILCKDITERPKFWIDREGKFVPRHSVYYIVPRNAAQIEKLSEHLNSANVAKWLDSHCQRVANGFLRLQSHVLKQIPVPSEFSVVQRTASRQTIRSATRLRREDVRTRQLEFGR